MNLSLNFWVELIALALLFGLVVYLMPRIRTYSIRKQQAINLRVRISDRINASLPGIALTAGKLNASNGQLATDTNTLEFALQRLKALMTEASVLYSDESERVQRFIDSLEKVTVDFTSGRARLTETEDLLLLGQRILLDLKENGLLSTTG